MDPNDLNNTLRDLLIDDLLEIAWDDELQEFVFWMSPEQKMRYDAFVE